MAARAKSGQITVTTAGTAVQGPDKDTATSDIFVIKALDSNTDTVYFGNDGSEDVTSANGFPLKPSEERAVRGLSLSKYWFDATVNGEGFAWLVP